MPRSERWTTSGTVPSRAASSACVNHRGRGGIFHCLDITVVQEVETGLGFAFQHDDLARAILAPLRFGRQLGHYRVVERLEEGYGAQSSGDLVGCRAGWHAMIIAAAAGLANWAGLWRKSRPTPVSWPPDARKQKRPAESRPSKPRIPETRENLYQRMKRMR